MVLCNCHLCDDNRREVKEMFAALPRCVACGEVWPCRNSGGEHMSVGEVEARARAAARWEPK